MLEIYFIFTGSFALSHSLSIYSSSLRHIVWFIILEYAWCLYCITKEIRWIGPFHSRLQKCSDSLRCANIANISDLCDWKMRFFLDSSFGVVKSKSYEWYYPTDMIDKYQFLCLILFLFIEITTARYYVL